MDKINMVKIVAIIDSKLKIEDKIMEETLRVNFEEFSKKNDLS